ncbi:hypothetical protein ACJ41O_012460 [Fusarium nematophilum]
MDGQMSSSVKRHAFAKAGKKSRKRASKACLVCRRRKVRCNVDSVGIPCLNCKLDNETCAVAERAPKSIRNGPNLFRAFGDGQLASSAASQPCHGSKAQAPTAVRRELDLVRTMPQVDDCNVSSAWRRGDEGSPQSSATGLNGLAWEQQAGLDFDQDTKTPAMMPWDYDSLESWDLLRSQQHLFTADVPHTAYPFIVIPDLHNLTPEDINYLDLKGCLRVPARAHLEEFLVQYFRYVHPFLPIINEHLFWEMYHDTKGLVGDCSPRMPLLVLQSMLFAACAFVPSSTLGKLGHSSVRNARRTMYQRAKILYSFETEKSRLHIGQAALLLSYWSPPFEEAASRPNTIWLSTAIESAKSVRAHLSQPAMTAPIGLGERHHQMSLKRLWACCIVRDCTLSISLRRTCQITGATLQLSQRFVLSYADLEEEVSRSRVYNASTKKHLIMAFLHLGEMCLRLSDVSMLLFPYESGLGLDKSYANRANDETRIQERKASLDEWHKTTLEELGGAKPSSGTIAKATASLHPSVTLFTNLMYIYYFSSRIAFANRHMLTYDGSAAPETHDIFERNEEVKDATSKISQCMRTLMDLQLARFLPVSVIACTALPLALHVINCRLTSCLPSSGPGFLIDAMKTYEYLYDGVEWVSETIKLIMRQRELVQLIESTFSGSTHRTKKWENIIATNPICYLRLAMTMDLSFSQGRLPEERDFPRRLRETPNNVAIPNQYVRYAAGQTTVGNETEERTGSQPEADSTDSATQSPEVDAELTDALTVEGQESRWKPAVGEMDMFPAADMLRGAPDDSITDDFPDSAIKFAANAFWSDFYMRLSGATRMDQTLAICTGASAGVTEAIVVVPFELVKIRLQDPAQSWRYRGPLDCALGILRRGGPMAMFQGFESTAWRHLVWNAGYFGSIFQVESIQRQWFGMEEPSMVRDFVAGSIGGTIGTLLNTPLDVVKTRIQSQSGPPRYSWTFPALVTIAREEGVRALYKGILPKLMRFCPGGGIILVVYTSVMDLLS